MRKVSIHEAKTHLSRFVEQAAAGEFAVPDDFNAPLPDDALGQFYEGSIEPTPSRVEGTYPYPQTCIISVDFDDDAEAGAANHSQR